MRLLTLLFFAIPLSIISQNVELSIREHDSKTAIPYAKVIYKNKSITSADASGKVILPVTYKTVEVSALGFDTVEVVLGGEKQTVYLSKVNAKIREVKVKIVIDTFAHQLVEKMKSRFDENHPDRLPSYQFLVYSKFTADAKEDSIKEHMTAKDSAERRELQDFTKHSKLFIWEKATIFKHDLNYGNKRVLLTSKMSGFKQPIYELLAMSLDDVHTIPRVFRADNAKEYYFRLEDSMNIDGRKCYQINFFPKKKYKTKRSRSGYVLIDAANYAMMKYQGTTKEGFAELTNQMLYGKCFTKEVFYNYTDVFFQIKNFKSTTTYRLKVDSITSPKIFSPSEFKGNENDISASLNNKSAIETLDKLRGRDTLDSRESNTYQSLDSIIEKNHIQTKLKLFLALRRGYIKWDKFHFSINDLIQVNRWEGLRLQVGGQTNLDFHNKIGLNSYIAYGFQDQQWKWGLGGSYLLNYYNNSKLAIQYQNDVLPVGRSLHELSHAMDRGNYFINQAYFGNYIHSENIKLSFQSDVHRYLEQKIFAQYSNISTKYAYEMNGINFEYISMFSTGLSLKYYPHSQYITTPEGKFAVKEKPTQMMLTLLAQAPLSSQMNLFYSSEMELKSAIYSPLGKTQFRLGGGMNLGDVPMIAMFEGKGNSKSNTDIINTFYLSSSRHFNTMEAGTFYSDRYAHLFLNHNLPGLKVFNRNLIFGLNYKAIWGELVNPTIHSIAIQAPHKLYQEIGLDIKNIFLIMGVGFYYRVGAYNSGNLGNNLAGRVIVDL